MDRHGRRLALVMLEPPPSGARRRPFQTVRRRRLASGLGALALVAAACGGDADVDAGRATTAPSTAATALGSTTATAVGADEVDATPTVGHLFPDVDVVVVADGTTVNLGRELAGGDRPVLLWFWAPH